MSQATISLDRNELESLLRRIVREELAHVLKPLIKPIIDDMRHEGPDDPAADQSLRIEALTVLEESEEDNAWMDWGDFVAELDQAEANGEVSHICYLS